MFRSECHLKLHVQNLGYPLPLKLGAQKPPFLTFLSTLQLNGNFNGLRLRNERRQQSGTALQTTKAPYGVQKLHERLSTNGLK